VCFHHVQAAAIAAESYFRLTNKWAVLNLTTGPGGINALNGVYGAYVDSLGLMVISGQVKRETYLKNYQIPMRQLGDQEVDIVSMARPIVKYATVLQDPEQVRVVMDKAIYLASSGRPGPVWVDVPIDVQSSLIEVGALKGFDVANTELLLEDPDITLNTRNEISLLGKCNLNDHIKIIVEKLKSSKRPVLFVGNGIRLSGAHDEFLRLVKELNIPVVTGWNAHDVLTNDNSCYAGRPGTVGDRAGNFTVQNADFVLVLGCRLNIRQISYNWKSFASRAWLAMVDIDAAELEKPTLKINLKVHADLKQFIAYIRAALSDYTPPPSHSEYMAWCAARVKKYPTVLAEYRKKTEPVNPYYFMEVLFDALNANDVIVAGNGSACVMSFQAAQLKNGQRLYTNSGSASMGYDLPAAIGASMCLYLPALKAISLHRLKAFDAYPSCQLLIVS
jgi:acetolactate synthase-1/2/3 large subunit